MAVFTYGAALPAFAVVHLLYDLDSLELVEDGDTQAVFEDENGYQIVLTGEFTYDSGVITEGAVTGVNLLDDVGGDLLSVTGTDFDALDLTAEFADEPDIWAFLQLLASGADVHHGNDNGTVIMMGDDHGDDEVFCGDGGSYVAGTEGKDKLHGGAEWDTLSYEETYWWQDARFGIVLNAAKGTVTDSWHDKDTFSGFEEYGGSIFNDRMTGSKRDEAFKGLDGRDTIDGGKGQDQVRYHDDHRYEGEDGIDANLAKGFVIDGFGKKDSVSNIEGVLGTNESDKFVGSAARNFFTGLDGVDSYDGGKGADIARFFYWNDIGQSGIMVDMTLATGQVINDGFGNTETLKRIEGIDGSQFDDEIKLGKGNGNWIYADAGNDRLEAGTGQQQWFSGGDGEDTFVFAALNTLGNKDTRDEIDDFNQGQGDQIDLSGIDGLVFGGEGALTGVAGEIRYVINDGQTVISIDTDGNGKANAQILVSREVEFEEGDFVLTV